MAIPWSAPPSWSTGVDEFVQPNQPSPANASWEWILAIVVVAAIGTAVVYTRRPDAISRAGSIGPEFVRKEAEGVARARGDTA